MSEKKNVLKFDYSQEILGLIHYEMKINKISASEVDTVDKAIDELEI